LLSCGANNDLILQPEKGEYEQMMHQPDHEQFPDPDQSSGVPAGQSPSTHTVEQVIDGYTLTFDSGGGANGSLYICEPRNSVSPVIDVDSLVTSMRVAEIWSEDEVKLVPDEHRKAYKEQLELIEAVEYECGEAAFLIARFDHHQFPSDDSRWADWKRFFDARYERTHPVAE
jgi:hypothetical protein